MGLQAQNYPVPFGGGLDTKSDERLVKPPFVRDLQNVIFTKSGQYAKRNGSAPLPYAFAKQAASMAALVAAGTYVGTPGAGSLSTKDSELVLCANGELSTYGKQDQAWVQKQQMRSVNCVTKTIFANKWQQAYPDCSTANGITVYAYEQIGLTTTAVYATVVDENTGAVLASNVQLSGTWISGNIGNGRPKVVAAGGVIYVLYAVSASELGSDLRYRALSTPAVANGFSAEQTLAASSLTQAGAAWTAIEDGAQFIVGYVNPGNNLNILFVQGATGNVNLSKLNLAMAVSQTTALDMCLSGTNVWFAFNGYLGGTYHAYVAAYDATAGTSTVALTNLVSLTTALPPRVTLCAQPAGSVQVFWETSTASVPRVHTVTVSSTGAVGAVDLLARSVGLASSAFYQDEMAHVIVEYPSIVQPTYLVYAWPASGVPMVVARLLATSAAPVAADSRRPAPRQSSAGVWLSAIGANTAFVSEAGNVTFTTQRVDRLSVDFTNEKFRTARLGRNLHVGGGVIRNYDSSFATELNFHVTPERMTKQNGSIGVGNYALGTNGNVSFTITPPVDDDSSFPAQPSGSLIDNGSYLVLWPHSQGGSTTQPSAGLLFFSRSDLGGFTLPAWAPGAATMAAGMVTLDGTETAQQVGFKIANELVYVNIGRLFSGIPSLGSFFTATTTDDTTGTVTVTTTGDNSSNVYPTPGSVDSTSMGYGMVIPGNDAGQLETDCLTFPAGQWIGAGQWFLLESSFKSSLTAPPVTGNTTVLCYFVVDGVGAAPTSYPSSVSQLRAIAIASTDDPSQVAGKVFVDLEAVQASGVACWTLSAAGAIIMATSTASAGSFSGSNNVLTLTAAASADTSIRNYNVGGGKSTGAREYYAVYVSTDADGQYHQSGPSIPLRVQTGLNDVQSVDYETLAYPVVLGQVTHKSNVLTIPTLRISERPADAVQIEVYTTVANQTVPALITVLNNDPTVDTLTYTDRFEDSAILDGKPLYTAGGTVPNQAPPAATIIEASQGRLWLAGISDDPDTIWYSQPWSPGYGVQFSNELTMALDVVGGAIVAIRAMDGYTVIFKGTRILALSGNGPDSTGANNAFTPPQIVNTDVGAVAPESIVFTQAGLMFQSTKGLYLLTRDLQTQYLGAPVESFVLGQAITSAVMLPDVSQVRFTTATGRTLLYDYVQQKWGTFTNFPGQSACVWQGLYARLDPAGIVNVETPGLYADGAKAVQMLIRTAWITLGDGESFGRVWHATVCGKYASGHKLRIQAAFDYWDEVFDSLEWNATAVLGSDTYGAGGTYGSVSPYGGTAEDPTYEVDAAFRITECKAIRLTISDLPDAPGASCTLSQLNLEIGLHPLGKSTTAAKRAS